MNWQDASEIYAGLILKGKQAVSAAPVDKFMPPYNNVIRRFKEGETVEDIIIAESPQPVQTAMLAADQLNGLGETTSWAKILDESYISYQAGKKLTKIANRLTYGEEVDWRSVSDLVYRATQSNMDEFIRMSDIKDSEPAFIESGWPAIDNHLVGWPKTGLVLIGGNAGVGKTTFTGKAAVKFAQHHPDKNVAIFSLEMMANEMTKRVRNTNNTTGIEDRIYFRDLPATPDEIIYKSAAIENLGMICVDFADLMIRGDTSESAMGNIYRTLAMGAKESHLRCPILLLAHPSRQYTGGIPRPYHIRWSGLAENLAWMIIMLYNPNIDYFAEHTQDILPIMSDVAYACVWKIRGGYLNHLENSPGAIAIPFKSDKGWHDQSLPNNSGWYNLKSLI